MRAIQINNTKEYLKFTSFLQNHGVIHCLPSPHTHQQNGITKKEDRYIAETGLILWVAASVSLKFQGDEVLIPTYLINYFPTPTLSSSLPFEKLFHKRPDYHFLIKIFGCACYLLFRPYYDYKLDFISIQCISLALGCNSTIEVTSVYP